MVPGRPQTTSHSGVPMRARVGVKPASFRTSSLSSEGINHPDSGFLEIKNVPSCDNQALNECCRRDQAVLNGHCPARGAQVRKESRPAETRRCIPWQAYDFRDAFVEPVFEPPSPASGWQEVDTETQFSKDDRINGKLALMASQPFNNFRVGPGLGRLAEDVRVDEVGHRVSVDSDARAVKNPFSGHASNQSTRLSFGGAPWRDNRYSPRSIRSISNSCPAPIPSRFRISAGSTI